MMTMSLPLYLYTGSLIGQWASEPFLFHLAFPSPPPAFLPSNCRRVWVSTHKHTHDLFQNSRKFCEFFWHVMFLCCLWVPEKRVLHYFYTISTKTKTQNTLVQEWEKEYERKGQRYDDEEADQCTGNDVSDWGDHMNRMCFYYARGYRHHSTELTIAHSGRVCVCVCVHVVLYTEHF